MDSESQSPDLFTARDAYRSIYPTVSHNPLDSTSAAILPTVISNLLLSLSLSLNDNPGPLERKNCEQWNFYNL